MPLVSDYVNDKFDVDLNYARQFEKLVAEIFEDGGRVEINHQAYQLLTQTIGFIYLQ